VFWGSIPGKSKSFSLLQKCPHWLWGPPQPLIQWMPEVKWPGCEGDHSPKSSAEVRMSGAIPLYALMAGTGTPSPFYSCCSLLSEFIDSSGYNAKIQIIPVLWDSICNIYTWTFTIWSSLLGFSNEIKACIIVVHNLNTRDTSRQLLNNYLKMQKL
jgi:hypothetical protein